MIPRSALDNLFLLLESTQTPMHVGALVPLAPGAESDPIRRLLTRRAARLPTLQLVRGRRGWVRAPHLQIASHVESVDIDDTHALTKLIGARMSSPLPAERPAWHIDVIEDKGGGRISLFLRIHHALADGVAASRLLAALADRGPSDAIGSGRQVPQTVEHGLVARSRQAMRGVAQQLSDIDTWLAPSTPFNRRLAGERELAWLPLPRAAIHDTARRLHASPNDVAVAACAGGLRTYLSQLDALPPRSLIATLPVSLQLHARDTHGGNRLSAIACRLGTDLDDPVKRLRLIRKQTFHAQRKHLTGAPHAFMNLAALLPGPAVSLAAGVLALTPFADHLSPLCNLIITNVPGERRTLTLGGWAIEGVYPFTPLFHGIGLVIALFGCGSTIGLGLTGSAATTPQLRDLVVAINEAQRELEHAARRA